MTLMARLLNVFAIPGSVFEDVRSARFSPGNWLVPMLLAGIIGAMTADLIFSQPAVVQEFRDSQKKNYDQFATTGKISRADADKMVDFVNRLTQPGVLRILGVTGAVTFSVFRVLGWALVLWLLGLIFLRTRIPFIKTLEVVGLATMISVLGGFVSHILTANFGDAGGVNLTLGELQARHQTPLRLLLLNVFNIWQTAVLAIGLARLAGIRFQRAFLLVMGFWIGLQMLLALIGIGVLGLTK